jgi:hypothetical protein
MRAPGSNKWRRSLPSWQITLDTNDRLEQRPKMWLANDGNYREMRHFTPWMRPRETELFHLPRMLADIQGETHVLFGDAIISTPETAFGAETCVRYISLIGPNQSLPLNRRSYLLRCLNISYVYLDLPNLFSSFLGVDTLTLETTWDCEAFTDIGWREVYGSRWRKQPRKQTNAFVRPQVMLGEPKHLGPQTSY